MMDGVATKGLERIGNTEAAEALIGALNSQSAQTAKVLRLNE